jgi:hypothetical protein
VLRQGGPAGSAPVISAWLWLDVAAAACLGHDLSVGVADAGMAQATSRRVV